MNEYEEQQRQLVKELKEIQNVDGRNEFSDNAQIRDNFELFMNNAVPVCGCGDPDKSLAAILSALDICALRDFTKRDALMKEIFNVESVYQDGLVQLLFGVLDDKGFIEHGGGINSSWLTDAGKIFREMLRLHLTDLSIDQILAKEYIIDIDALLAKEEN